MPVSRQQARAQRIRCEEVLRRCRRGGLGGWDHHEDGRDGRVGRRAAVAVGHLDESMGIEVNREVWEKENTVFKSESR